MDESPDRKSFPLRLPRKLFDDMQRWAKDDLRSLNAQIEFVLREALRRRGRGGGEPLSTDAVAKEDES